MKNAKVFHREQFALYGIAPTLNTQFAILSWNYIHPQNACKLKIDDGTVCNSVNIFELKIFDDLQICFCESSSIVSLIS